MTRSMPPISYIGGDNDNDYMASVSEDIPYIQSLNVNDNIEAVVMSQSIDLAETAIPKVMSSPSANIHPYKKPVNGELVQYTITVAGVQTDVIADNMPKHLTGWKAYNNTTHQYDDFIYQTLTNEVITNYGGQNNEIALYGKWDDIALIRVIFFISFTTFEQDINCSYTSSLTAENSYDENLFNPYYKLSDNYKSIVDYWNPSYKTVKEDYPLPEFGSGDGCLTKIENINYPTYYATTYNDIVNFEICSTSGNFIPSYQIVPDEGSVSGYKPLYHFFTTNALRCDFLGWEKNTTMENFGTPYLNNDNKLCWSSERSITISNDTTIVVPLVTRPILTVSVSPDSNDYHAYINTTNEPTEGLYMPNDSCTVNTRTTVRGATFDGWYTSAGLVSTNNIYTFKILRNTHIVAKWNPPTEPPTPSYPYVELSYYLIGNLDTSFASSSTNPVQYCKNGSTWITLTNTNIINFRHSETQYDIELRCPITSFGSGQNHTEYMFRGFKEYFGSSRNPAEDETLSNGDFAQGGSYTAIGIETPYSGFKFTMSNLANNQSYKIYAVYVPIAQ